MVTPAATRSNGAEMAATGAHHLRRCTARFLDPAQQCIAAEGDAGGDYRRAGAFADSAEDPAHLLEVSRVVAARRQVQFARKAAEMRHAEVQLAGARCKAEGQGITAHRIALQTMEEHDPWSAGHGRQVVPIDEVAIESTPAFARVSGCLVKVRP
jgi:hypothetical protein